MDAMPYRGGYRGAVFAEQNPRIQNPSRLPIPIRREKFRGLA